MKHDYLNIYNNLIKLTRNKLLFDKLKNQETFSDRLTIFLLHFAFFLREYKESNSKDELQSIYDFNFKQIEISLREIGYGDMSINKKMKQYINLFHLIITRIQNWPMLENSNKTDLLIELLGKTIETEYFIKYFEKYRLYLSKKPLYLFTKDIIEIKI